MGEGRFIAEDCFEKRGGRGRLQRSVELSDQIRRREMDAAVGAIMLGETVAALAAHIAEAEPQAAKSCGNFAADSSI